MDTNKWVRVTVFFLITYVFEAGIYTTLEVNDGIA